MANTNLVIPRWGLWLMFLSGLVGLFLMAHQLGIDGWL